MSQPQRTVIWNKKQEVAAEGFLDRILQKWEVVGLLVLCVLEKQLCMYIVYQTQTHLGLI